jgi:DNA-binding XRE family transcriptional regulator
LNIIKRKREKLGIPQVELAKRLNVGRSAVCNYEKGTRLPRVDLARKIGKVLDFPWHKIYEGDGADEQ